MPADMIVYIYISDPPGLYMSSTERTTKGFSAPSVAPQELDDDDATWKRRQYCFT